MNKSILRLPDWIEINSVNTLTCFLLLFSTSLFSQTCPGNLPTNSGFEQGTSGWNIIAGAATTFTDANSGSSALELGGASGANTINQAFVGQPNTFYSLRAFMKKNNTDNTQPQARVKFYTSAWQPINSPIERISNSTYEQIVLGNKSPSNTAYVGVEFSYNTNPNDQKVLIDDVCFLEEPNNANCSISATAVNLTCDNNGTPVNQLDDTFTADILVTGSNKSSGWRLVNSRFNFTNGIYDSPMISEVLRIADGPRTYTIKDYGNEDCQTILTINPPPTCSNSGSGCDIDLALTQPICNDNGTPNNPLDDTYTFQATFTGTNTGSGWTSNVSALSNY